MIDLISMLSRSATPFGALGLANKNEDSLKVFMLALSHLGWIKNSHRVWSLRIWIKAFLQLA